MTWSNRIARVTNNVIKSILRKMGNLNPKIDKMILTLICTKARQKKFLIQIKFLVKTQQNVVIFFSQTKKKFYFL